MRSAVAQRGGMADATFVRQIEIQVRCQKTVMVFVARVCAEKVFAGNQVAKHEEMQILGSFPPAPDIPLPEVSVVAFLK